MIAEALAEAENPNGARVAAAASSGEDSPGATEGAWGSRIYKAVMTGTLHDSVRCRWYSGRPGLRFRGNYCRISAM